MANDDIITDIGKKRTQVDDIDRSMYDFRYEDADAEKLEAGLTPDIVREISERKDEPEWMLEHRLRSLEVFNSIAMSDWGPSIDGLDMDNIVTYVKPNTDQKSDWESVPDNIKDTFDRLGIPQAERSYLAGVGAQYDSELVYHSMQESAAKMGIVYSGIEEALHGEYADLIREKFMTLIPPTDHKFAALHGAVWSGGSFVYVPKGVKLDYPLQSYFRLNAKGAGQFEHTLIIVEDDADLHFIEGCSAPKYNVANLHAGAVELFVGKRAHLRYSTIENWSKNMYNLNTKRCRCDEEGEIEWISGSFGSHVGYLYPMSILAGRKAREGSRSRASRSPGAGRTSTPAARWCSPRPTRRRASRRRASRRTAASRRSAARWWPRLPPKARAAPCRASRSCSTTAAAPTPSPRWTSAARTSTSATRPPSGASATTRCSTS